MSTSPPSGAEKLASDDDPEAQATFPPAHATSAQMKVKNLSRRIRSLVNGATAEHTSNIANTPVEIHMTTSSVSRRKGSPDGAQMLDSMSSPSLAARHLNLSKRIVHSPEVGPARDVGDICLSTAEICSADLQAGNATVGGTSDSQKCSTTASSDSRRFSTGHGRSDLRRMSSFSRKFMTSAKSDSQSLPAPGASESQRYSTEFTIYCPRLEVQASTIRSKELDPVRSIRALLNPATSVQTVLSLICTEETLVSSSESRSQLRVTNSKRYPGSEMLPPLGLLKGSTFTQDTERYPSGVLVTPTLSRRFASASSTRDFDLSSRALTIPEIDAAEVQDEYSNSNVSWSKPLESCPPEVDSTIKEESRQRTSGASTSSIPSEHFPTVYVGMERKKFVIPFHVITHELFKQLLDSDFYKVEEIDGEVSIVLSCDTDYFQRLLFFLDQRKIFDIEARHDAGKSLSSMSKRHDSVRYDIVT